MARLLNGTYWERKQEEERESPTPWATDTMALAEAVPVSQPVKSHVPVLVPVQTPVNVVEVSLIC